MPANNQAEKRQIIKKFFLSGESKKAFARDQSGLLYHADTFRSNLHRTIRERAFLERCKLFIFFLGLSSLFAVLVFGIFFQLIEAFLAAETVREFVGLWFASLALCLGVVFFLYSLKYYLSVGLVLILSRKINSVNGNGARGVFKNGGKKNGNNLNFLMSHNNGKNGKSLIPDLNGVKLERHPFVSIHLPLYNEERVVNRLLNATTSFEYDRYEVVVVDDSVDKTRHILDKWKDHPRVKVIHRDSRIGYKGGALAEAVKFMDPQAEFVMIVDSDFLPYPDTITQFLKYFMAIAGTLDFSTTKSDSSIAPLSHGSNATSPASPPYQGGDQGVVNHAAMKQGNNDSPIAAIQGYQWHVLNKSENWITKAVRSEYAGSYVVERSAVEIYQGLKQIAGSVFVIRADILKKAEYQWGVSLTEDFELTLKLYRDGYKIVYTPYIQVPSECVSTLKRIIRQRMRWAEGHSHNIRKYFKQLLFGRFIETKEKRATTSFVPWFRTAIVGRGSWVPSDLTLTEKLEFLYLSPYYLQAAFFMVGTFSWYLSEAVFKVNLPFWTQVSGWSLVLFNLLSLPLLNTVGLFLEESKPKDYLGIPAFLLLTYILAPFQAFATLKGFIRPQESPWARTPKTGKITDTLQRGKFFRYISGVFPSKRLLHPLR